MPSLQRLVKNIFIIFCIAVNIYPQAEKGAPKNQLGNGLLSLAAIATLSQTDYSQGKIDLGAVAQAEYFLSQGAKLSYGLRLSFGGQVLRGQDQNKIQPEFMTDMYVLGGGVIFGYNLGGQFYPYLYGGVSNLWFSPKDSHGKRLFNNSKNLYDRTTSAYDIEVGSRLLIQENLSFFLGLGAHFVQSDNLDDISFGTGKDSYYSARLGISFALVNKKDSDNDGISDSDDPCPSNAEDYDGYKDADGCPDYDNDGDKIFDERDNCPDAAEDMDGFDDTDGCPDYDNDGDGILDKEDKCPLEAENFNGYEDGDGCPDILSNLQKILDRDADGISDEFDKCPDQLETFNGFEDDDGCPDSITMADTLSTKELILEGNDLFDWRSAEIKISAHERLNKLAEFLSVDPFIKWAVESYTDNSGNADSLKTLSQQRAISLIRYFIDKGLPSFMFKIYAKGGAEPIAENNTLEGRMKNNRIVIRKLP
ncbi:MAG: OmpA family protein [Ignavibacteriaceae bacterium]|nr:OmpA family protein [Ignavibacteriaceae bacterium]